HIGRALPNALIVVRIDPNLAVVHRSRIQIAHLLPGLAAVFGTEDSALGVFDDRVDDVRVRAVDANATDVTALGQVFSQLLPRRAAVNCFVEPAARTAAVEAPGNSSPLISRGVKSSGTLRIDCDIDYAGVFVDKQRLRPRLAAIGCLVDSAFAIWPPQVADYRDVNDVWIARVDNDPANMLRIPEPHVLPGLAAVERTIDTVAPRRTLSIIRLAGTDPDDIRVRGRYADVADRRRSLLVEDRLEGRAGVCGFPYAAGRGSYIEGRGVAVDNREVVDASAHVSGTD